MAKAWCAAILVAVLAGLLVQQGSANFASYYHINRAAGAKMHDRLADWVNHVALAEQETLRRSGHDRIAHWREQLDILSRMPKDRRQLQQLNILANSDVTYVADYRHYHKKDVWAGPVEALEEGGDCEDMALIKATMLKWLGWPETSYHLLIGTVPGPDKPQPHAVLVVDAPDGTAYVLDSRHSHIERVEDTDIAPVIAYDSAGPSLLLGI